jgi:hypothetical protein
MSEANANTERLPGAGFSQSAGSANLRGELEPAEPHPAAYEAKAWIAKQPVEELLKWREAFATCAIEGNRLGAVCAETLNRLLNSQPVSDRYLLGLAWTMRSGNWPNVVITHAAESSENQTGRGSALGE